MIHKMEKKFLVSFLLAVSVLLLAFNVSAADLATITNVEVDGLNVSSDPAITVGDTVTVRIEFSSLVNVSDVTVEAEIEGDREDVRAETNPFDVEQGFSYSRSLRLEVPFDLKDTLSGPVTLNVDISGSGLKTEATYTLRLQREPYDVAIKAVSVPQTVEAGDLFPVDVVLKNLGYSNLDDLEVTASIPALGVQRTSFFGDLVALECDDDVTSPVDNWGVDINRKCNEDDEDTVAGRLFLQLPWDVESGVYALEVTAESDDTTSSKTVQVAIENAFSSGNFIVSGSQLLIVNPTNDVVVYRLIPESTSAVSVSVSESLVAVPAGSSKTVMVSADSNVAGTQTYAVNVFSADGALLDRVQFTTSEGNGTTSPIVVLTVILAIIFIVLLVVLIVLIGKKPEKEEFGESYY